MEGVVPYEHIWCPRVLLEDGAAGPAALCSAPGAVCRALCAACLVSCAVCLVPVRLRALCHASRAGASGPACRLPRVVYRLPRARVRGMERNGEKQRDKTSEYGWQSAAGEILVVSHDALYTP